jgi:hypothetical protein
MSPPATCRGRNPVPESIIDLPTHLDRATHADPNRTQRSILCRPTRTICRRAGCRDPSVTAGDLRSASLLTPWIG